MAEILQQINDVITGIQTFTLFAPVYGCIVAFITVMQKACGFLISLMTDGFSTLITNDAIQAYLQLLQIFASILFVAGIAMAISEWAINSNEGSANNVMSTFKYILLGLFVTLGFTAIPILLMQFTAECTNLLISAFSSNPSSIMDNLILDHFTGGTDMGGVILWYVFLIIFIIDIVKIFLSNMKRGGVMIILLSVCPFHIFSIPRGHVDAFFSWCKQMIALYVTTLVQNLFLAISLRVIGESSITTADMCMCIGLLTAAVEAPQWMQMFGLDTSVKASPTQAIYAASGVTNIIGTFSKMA